MIMRMADRLDSSCALGAIRQGMIMMIPLLVVGYLAAMLINLPIPAYQTFIAKLCGGHVLEILNFVYASVNEFFAVFLAVTTTVSYAIMKRRKQEIYEGTGNIIILVIITLAALVGYFGIQYDDFSIHSLSNMHAFTALFVALISGKIYYTMKSSRFFKVKNQRTNTDGIYIEAIEGIAPAVVIIGFFAFFRILLQVLFGVSGFQELVERFFDYLLKPLQNGLGAGVVIIFLTHALWFFGIHGHNMLDTVIKQNFSDITAGIFSKTMQDVFVLLGGVGAVLCLVIAILLFAKKKGVRNLAYMAAPSLVFNISEIVLFGVPVILNPILLIPFMLIPMVNYLVTYAAMFFGLVPHVIREVDWTTPVILSGYQATGSWAGAVLQILCLAIGVCIYKPFIRMYEEQRELRLKRDVKRLVEEMQREEQNNSISPYTKREDEIGHMARILADELVEAIRRKELFLVYQPQVNRDGRCIGAEALIRWEHPEFGFIYPPLIIQLAKEKKVLSTLEKFIFDTAGAALAQVRDIVPDDFKMSVNLTNESLEWDGIEACIENVVQKYQFPNVQLGLEITEQDALSSSIDITKKIEALKAKGHRFLIDDFGMGHTSLVYLQTKYFNIVKLDGSLTRDVIHNETNRDIIASIVYLGRSLKFKIIAEYVENEAQRDELKKLGCDAFQGYLYSKPIKLDELMSWIKGSGHES